MLTNTYIHLLNKNYDYCKKGNHMTVKTNTKQLIEYRLKKVVVGNPFLKQLCQY